MYIVSEDLCIGCGKCVSDCFVKDIEMVDNKAVINNKHCIKCGHCIAICPSDAVRTDTYNMEEVIPYNKEKFDVEPDQLLNFIKFRRTIRQFKGKDVEQEKINKIIEAGRFTQTGSNAQDVSYIVVKEGLSELRGLTLKRLNDLGQYMLTNLNDQNRMYKIYAELWVNMHESFLKDPNAEDRLFFNAPAVIVVIGNSEFNGAIASSNMELMTNALGLGTLYSGFFKRAAQDNDELRDFLKLEQGKEIVAAMVIGYPDVKYVRTVPRKEADVLWM